MTPAVLRLSPAGSEPDTTDHVSELPAPLAARLAEYGVLRRPAVREVVVIPNVPTVKLAVAVAPQASVTVRPKVAEPIVVGCPEMVPLMGSRLRPPGSAPDAIDHILAPAPPWVARICEYVVPMPASGSEAVVIAGSAST